MARHRVRSILLLVSAAVPAIFLLAGAAAKLSDPVPPAQFVAQATSIADFRAALMIVCGTMVAEAVLAVALCLLAGRSRLPAYAAIALLGLFIAALLRVIRSAPGAASCGCFGSLLGSRFETLLDGQLILDIGLVLILCAHLLLSASSPPQYGPAPDEIPAAEGDGP